MREMSRTSLISSRRCRPPLRICSTLSRSWPPSACIWSNCPKPRIALRGVRSSWLMRERKSLFARLARSASALASASSWVRSRTRCSSSSECRFTASARRACVMAMASCAAASRAISTCSSENCPRAPPKESAPMSSPRASMGTTMYTWTPEASSAVVSGPSGIASTSITCVSPRRSASTSPMSFSG